MKRNASESSVIAKKRRSTVINKITEWKRKLTGRDNRETKVFDNFEEFTQHHQKLSEVKFNIFNYVVLALKTIWKGKKNVKERLFEKAENAFLKEIDIIQILKSVQDVEKLKFLLLNQKQVALFELIDKKPMVLSREMKKRESIIGGQKNISEEEAFHYYLELEKQESESEVEKRLLVLLNQHYKKVKQLYK